MIKLIGNRVIIARERPIEKTLHGVYLPEQSQDTRNVGLVIEIGDTVPVKYLHQRVIFPPMVGEEMIYEGVESVLLFYPEIIALL